MYSGFVRALHVLDDSTYSLCLTDNVSFMCIVYIDVMTAQRWESVKTLLIPLCSMFDSVKELAIFPFCHLLIAIMSILSMRQVFVILKKLYYVQTWHLECLSDLLFLGLFIALKHRNGNSAVSG